MIYSPSKDPPKSSQIRHENVSNFEMKTSYSSISKLNDVKKKEISRKDGKFCFVISIQRSISTNHFLDSLQIGSNLSIDDGKLIVNQQMIQTQLINSTKQRLPNSKFDFLIFWIRFLKFDTFNNCMYDRWFC